MLVGRAVLILAAWLSYYNAAARLPLAELTSIYFAAPIVAVVAAVLVLKERVVAARWIAVVGGFCGVVLAADPRGGGTLLPIGLALFAAVCWGLSVVMVRLINRSETTAGQMLASNVLFVVACLPMAIWAWHMPDAFSMGLMLALGVFGGLGQYFLYEGFRYAPASAVAPVEYSGLVWAFVYGYVIWGEVPGPPRGGRRDADRGGQPAPHRPTSGAWRAAPPDPSRSRERARKMSWSSMTPTARPLAVDDDQGTDMMVAQAHRLFQRHLGTDQDHVGPGVRHVGAVRHLQHPARDTLGDDADRMALAGRG